jgi:hypothetical protein
MLNKKKMIASNIPSRPHTNKNLKNIKESSPALMA